MKKFKSKQWLKRWRTSTFFSTTVDELIDDRRRFTRRSSRESLTTVE